METASAELLEYVWRSRKAHAERFGHRCYIVGQADGWRTMRVRFEDGVVVDCMRTSIRRAPTGR